MGIGEFLKTEREKRGISQRKLSLLSGLSNSEISRIESGERKNPSPDVLRSLAAALQLPYRTLLEQAGYIGGEPEMAPEFSEQAVEYCFPPDLADFVREEVCRDWAFTRLARFVSQKNLTPQEILAIVESYVKVRDSYLRDARRDDEKKTSSE